MQPDERALGTLQLGQRAVASAEPFPKRTFDAVVEWIAPRVDPERGTVDVRLVVSKPPDYVRTDMTVSVTVTVAEKRAALVVPRDAVRDVAGATPWVDLLRDGEPARRVDVRVGLRSATDVELSPGVAEGDRLVLPEAAVSGGTQEVHPWD